MLCTCTYTYAARTMVLFCILFKKTIAKKTTKLLIMIVIESYFYLYWCSTTNM